MSLIDPLEGPAVAPAPTLLSRLEETLGRAPASDLAAVARSETLLDRLESVLSLAPASGLTAVARQLGMSRRSLQRACAAAAIDFQSVRAHVRLARAESLLGDSDMKIASVAGEIGFASTAHFIAWFRRLRGVTPGAWRTRTP